MATRDAALLVGGLVVGAAAAVTLGGGFGVFLGDTETAITLRADPGQPCAVTGNQTEILVGKNKKLTFKVQNHCNETVTVAVGNFRTTGAGANTNCSAATEGGATSPFKEDDEPQPDGRRCRAWDR